MVSKVTYKLFIITYMDFWKKQIERTKAHRLWCAFNINLLFS